MEHTTNKKKRLLNKKNKRASYDVFVMHHAADNFLKGMSSIDLFPYVYKPTVLTPRSPWIGVAASFRKTGDNMMSAMEQMDAQLKSKS